MTWVNAPAYTTMTSKELAVVEEARKILTRHYHFQAARYVQGAVSNQTLPSRIEERGSFNE